MFPCCCGKLTCEGICMEVVFEDVDYSITLVGLDAPVPGSWITANERLVAVDLQQKWQLYLATGAVIIDTGPLSDCNLRLPSNLVASGTHACDCAWVSGTKAGGDVKYQQWLLTYRKTCEVCDGAGCESCDEEGVTGNWFVALLVKAQPFSSYEPCWLPGIYWAVFEKELEPIYDEELLLSQDTRCWWNHGRTIILDHVCTVCPNQADPADLYPAVPDFSLSTVKVKATGVETCDSPTLSWLDGNCLHTCFRMSYCPSDADELLNFVQVTFTGLRTNNILATSPCEIKDIETDAGVEGNEWRITTITWGEISWFGTLGQFSSSNFHLLGRTDASYTVFWYDENLSTTQYINQTPISKELSPSGRRTGVSIGLSGPSYFLFGGVGDDWPAYDATIFLIAEGVDRNDPDCQIEAVYGTRSWENVNPDDETPTFGVEVGEFCHLRKSLVWFDLTGSYLLRPGRCYTYDWIPTYHFPNEWRLPSADHPNYGTTLSIRASYDISQVSGTWQTGWVVSYAQNTWNNPGYQIPHRGFSAGGCCPQQLDIPRYYAEGGIDVPQNAWLDGTGTVSVSCILVKTPPGAIAQLDGKSDLAAVASNGATTATAALLGKSDLAAVASNGATTATAALLGKSDLGAAATNDPG